MMGQLNGLQILGCEVQVEFCSPNCPKIFEFVLLMSAFFLQGVVKSSFEDPSN